MSVVYPLARRRYMARSDDVARPFVFPLTRGAGPRLLPDDGAVHLGYQPQA